MTVLLLILVAIAMLALALLLSIWWRIFRLLRDAWAAGVRINIIELVGMGIRKVDVRAVVDAAILAARSGVKAPLDRLELHALMDGNLNAVVRALIAAKAAGVQCSFTELADADLARLDLHAIVQGASEAQQAGWLLPVAEVIRISRAGHNPVDYVRAEIGRGTATVSG